MTASDRDTAAADNANRLRLLARWADADQRAVPELRVFEEASAEIEFFRSGYGGIDRAVMDGVAASRMSALECSSPVG